MRGRRPSAGTVIATLALFVALGGTAAALQGRNTVQNNDVQDLKFVPLQLRHGWEAYGNGLYPPAAALDAQGQVHLRGAIDQPSGTSNTAFRLPKSLRPKFDVVEPVTMLSEIGHVKVDDTGTVGVVATSVQTDAQAETDLEGVTFSAR